MTDVNQRRCEYGGGTLSPCREMAAYWLLVNSKPLGSLCREHAKESFTIAGGSDKPRIGLLSIESGEIIPLADFLAAA